MGLSQDSLVRGYQFDNATGLKTGANLEDLTTRATLTDGSEFVDQASLTAEYDAGLGIYRGAVKDGGITRAKLAPGAILGDLLPLSASNVVLGTSLVIGNLANMFDGSDDTYTDEFTLAPATVRTLYVDLGSVKRTHVELLHAVRTPSGTGTFSMYCGSLYDAIPYKGTDLGAPLHVNLQSVYTSSGTTMRSSHPFWAYGRYISFIFYVGGASATVYIKLAELRVWEVC